MGKIIGIDLGTTNSCVAVLEGGQPAVITNTEGGRTTPSIVGFGKAGDRLVGQLAKRQAVTNPLNTVYSIKRFIGRRWDDTADERGRVPYTCVGGKDNTVDVEIRGKKYTPQEISSMILQRLKQDAETYLGEEVTQAVITVPAYFTDAQRQATKDAGTIAGLEVLRIINEPTAAALAYGLDKQDQELKILVFDLGGGTFDVSVLQLGDGIFEVKSTAGNNHLGGDDFDNCIVQWLIQNFKEKEDIDLAEDKMALQRLKEAAEKAKIELSSAKTSLINLPFITAGATGPKHLEVELSKTKFEELIIHLVKATIEPVAQSLKDAGLKGSQIDKILLVGGSTRTPLVQRAIIKYFGGKEPDRTINPDEAVALGAAIQAGVLGGEVRDVLLLDVTPLSLGLETLGGVFTKIIEKNTTIPTSQSQIFSTAVDNQSSVEIHVLQGERAMVKDNKSLGKFMLTGIPPAPRGLPQIEVSFDIDANGILNVSATDRSSGKAQSISITNTGGLSESEVEKMRQEAEIYAADDLKYKEMAVLLNQVDIAIYNYENNQQAKLTEANEELAIWADQAVLLLKHFVDYPEETNYEELKDHYDTFQQALLNFSSSSSVPSEMSPALSEQASPTLLEEAAPLEEASPTLLEEAVPISEGITFEDSELADEISEEIPDISENSANLFSDSANDSANLFSDLELESLGKKSIPQPSSGNQKVVAEETSAGDIFANPFAVTPNDGKTKNQGKSAPPPKSSADDDNFNPFL